MNKICIACIIGIAVIVGMTLFIDNEVRESGSERYERYERFPVYINGNVTQWVYTEEDISVSTYNYSFAIGEDMAIVNNSKNGE